MTLRTSPDTLYHEPASLELSAEGSVLFIRGEVDASTGASFNDILVATALDHGIDSIDLSQISFFGTCGVEPLHHFSRCFTGEIVVSRSIDRVLDILGVRLG